MRAQRNCVAFERTDRKSLRVTTFLKLYGALYCPVYFRLTGANLLFYFPLWHLLAQNEEAMAQNLVKLLLTTATNLSEYPPAQTEPHRWSDPGISFFPLFLMNEPKSYTISSHSFPPHMPKTFSPHLSLLTAVKNQVTGNFILNAKSEDAETKTFIENGLLWEYSNNADKETLKTSGPLHEGIVVLVSGTGSALCIQFSWLSV